MPAGQSIARTLATWIAAIDRRTGFDRWGPDANPLIRHTRRRAGRLSLRRMLWLVFALGLGVLAIMSALTLRMTNHRIGLGETLLLIFAILFYLVAPYIAAGWANVLAYRVTRPDRFDLLRITPLPDATLIHAVLFAALHRLRWLWGLLVVLMPFLVIGAFRWWIAAVSGSYSLFATTSAVDQEEIVIGTLTVLLLVIDGWGFVVLGAVLGVYVSLIVGGGPLAGMAAQAALTLAAGLHCCGLWCGLMTVASGSAQSVVDPAIMLFAVMLFIPYGLTVLLIGDLKVRWRR